MAGSGKTTLIQQINSYLHRVQRPGYIINLDPAVTHMPYSPNIDIRDTVKYKTVMQVNNGSRVSKTGAWADEPRGGIEGEQVRIIVMEAACASANILGRV